MAENIPGPQLADQWVTLNPVAALWLHLAIAGRVRGVARQMQLSMLQGQGALAVGASTCG
ncbi:hypothetical protein J2X53_001548 [Pseudorhodobacter sp. 4114]|nr:hypothetical protein [Pseudorhodobacter sp. 4114]